MMPKANPEGCTKLENGRSSNPVWEGAKALPEIDPVQRGLKDGMALNIIVTSGAGP
jgi:hypothetical protein